jgi:hypothetical protein
MELEILIFSTIIAILLPMLALSYLGTQLKAIFDSACNNQAATRFWLKCIQILAITGSLILVIGIAINFNTTSWLQIVRTTLVWTSTGIFISVAIVAKIIWSDIVKPAVEAMQQQTLAPNGGER